MNATYARLSPYQLATEYRSLCQVRCTTWQEDDQRQTDLDAIGAEMDRRDVRLEDWAN